MIGGIEHNRLLITQLVQHAHDKVIDIGHAIIVRVDQLRFRAFAVHAHTLRLPLRKAARVTLSIVKVRTFGMENNQVFTMVILHQRALNLIHQQHVVHAFAAVTRFSANLLTIGNAVRHGIAVEPHLALHRIQVAGKAELVQDSKDVLLLQRSLRVVFRPTLTHKHAAQREFGRGIAGVAAEGHQVFLLSQLRRGIAVITQDPHMVPAGGFTDNEHHVGIIQALRLDIGEFFGRVYQRLVI